VKEKSPEPGKKTAGGLPPSSHTPDMQAVTADVYQPTEEARRLCILRKGRSCKTDGYPQQDVDDVAWTNQGHVRLHKTLTNAMLGG
jgi:hypothetical protein